MTSIKEMKKKDHQAWLKKIELWDPVFVFSSSYWDVCDDSLAILGQVVAVDKKEVRVKWYSGFHKKDCEDCFSLKDGTCVHDGDKRPLRITKCTRQRADRLRTARKSNIVRTFDCWFDMNVQETEWVYDVLRSWAWRMKEYKGNSTKLKMCLQHIKDFEEGRIL